MLRMGSAAQYLYDVPFSDSEEDVEEYDYSEEEESTDGAELAEPEHPNTWALSAFLAPVPEIKIQSVEKKGKVTRDVTERKAATASKRGREAQQLAEQLGPAFAVHQTSASQRNEEWHVTLTSDRGELGLVFCLPEAYPPAPPTCTRATLSSSTPSPLDENESQIDELHSNALTGLLQDQASKHTRVSRLVTIAKEWLEQYAVRVKTREEQMKEEAERRAREELAAARVREEALEEERRALAEHPDGIKRSTTFRNWLKRVGIRTPKSMHLIDMDAFFERRLAKRKKTRPAATQVDQLGTICIKALAECLLRYESLAGFPVDMRMRIFDYLAVDLRLLYPQHLQVLLDDEFLSLDFSGFVRPDPARRTNKTQDSYVRQVGDRCPRLRDINLAGAAQITNAALTDGISKCSQLTRLVLDDCVKVGDVGIAAAAEGCPLLVEFSAKRCTAITHNALDFLGRRCINLEIVRIAGCVRIHGNGLIHFTRLTKYLQVLDAEMVGTQVGGYVKDHSPAGESKADDAHPRWTCWDRSRARCPSLTSISVRECPRIANGTFEQVILPRCPRLHTFHHSETNSVPTQRGITEVDLDGLSFLNGCKYVFPIRTPKLPALLGQMRDQLSRDNSPKQFTRLQIERVVCRRSAFLLAADRFDGAAAARHTLRNIHTLTLAGCAWESPYNLIELIISLPALRYLDVSRSPAELKEVLFSCYHFLPHLHTLVFKKDVLGTNSAPAFTGFRWRDTREHEFRQREEMIKAKLLKDMKADNARVRQMGEQAESELKRKQWVVEHIAGDDKRHSMSLTSLDISDHTFNDDAFIDWIADRLPELRRLGLERSQGLGGATLVTLLEKCVHLSALDVRGLSLPDHRLAELRGKRPTLELLAG